ncbi:MAG TPA: bifunctional precorrin-2 dehydrogenase/sirohydrochlorin ferrochelatase [Candidatus Limnocylindria bacterium]|nr:bifunctional precorrin-2 dehydrogenase/sirohydrochlorin ferrochelatase [Candidatus Limnocylindria bacterium]
MGTHPVFLCLAGRRCVVLGGDARAAAKALACRRAGAAVVVVAAEVVPELGAAIAAGRVVHVARDYQPGDLAGAFVCYASLRDPQTVERVRAEASRSGTLLNVIDVPEACDFFSPAVVERGALQLAIGTGGESPALAAHLRERLEAEIGAEFGTLVEMLGELRRRLAGRADRQAILRQLAGSELPALLRRGDTAAIDRLLDAAGAGCSLAELGIAPEPRP